ncbi:MAG: virginiamycin B lyase family protein [Actinomycetota bacterium]
MRRAVIAVLVVAGAGFVSCENDTDGERAAPSPTTTSARSAGGLEIEEFDVPDGSRPHDVAVADDGTVWYTAQATGEIGKLDPDDGSTEHIDLGEGSAPHGVIIGPDDAAWITDSGLNAMVRVDPETEDLRVYPLPGNERANLNTAAFDRRGVLWFTGQAGFYGSVQPVTGQVRVYDAPGGRGPYGITGTPGGDIYYASLAGDHIARVDTTTGEATRIDPPSPGTGPRRVWSDSEGNVWISEWEAGKVGRYSPDDQSWEEWDLPGEAQTYAVFVDDRDIVWLSDFGNNTLVRFDPETEKFTSLELPADPGNVRQILGRPGEVWGAESAADALVVVRTS